MNSIPQQKARNYCMQVHVKEKNRRKNGLLATNQRPSNFSARGAASTIEQQLEDRLYVHLSSEKEAANKT